MNDTQIKDTLENGKKREKVMDKWKWKVIDQEHGK